ncbi:hypothetical protein [Lacipirellula limnantheis]|uniref:Uncharacterized protein n=1 Tax=Lacipirellula limnantheis TaxID=2528024 RepID=A0A517TX45_9BACT|nr:hypothetical protein [Lacipirellula limnantheis]QDT72946.1 hypothetical protein I41_21330 [Lacipirellula limnantheis]
MWKVELDFSGWNVPPQSHPSLPGQKQLFSHLEISATHDAVAHNASGRELFVTGRDLPGAQETAQAILWDIEK